jgi:polyhydroxybutyrate depolymerase
VSEPESGRRPRAAAILLGGVAVAIVVVVVVVVVHAASGNRPSAQVAAGAVPGVTTTTTESPPSTTTQVIQVIGPRPAPIVYRPPGLSRSRPVPLVVAFYGATGTPQDMEGLTKFEELADQDGFVIAYPGSQTNPPWRANNDVQYIGSLISQIRASQNIDPRRIYLTGFSAGGRETYFLGCRLSSEVAAIGVVSSVMRSYPCTIPHPISEVTLAGSTEPIYGTGGIPSAASVAARWRGLNGCPTATPVVTTVTSVTEQTWSGCRGGSAVALWVLQGGHHTWPGSFGLAPSDPDAQFDASAELWAFFAAHPLHG